MLPNDPAGQSPYFLTHRGEKRSGVGSDGCERGHDPFGIGGLPSASLEYGFPGEDVLGAHLVHFLLNPIRSLSFLSHLRVALYTCSSSFFLTTVTHYYHTVSSHSLTSFRWFLGTYFGIVRSFLPIRTFF
jgi:hypothetical protein